MKSKFTLFLLLGLLVFPSCETTKDDIPLSSSSQIESSALEEESLDSDTTKPCNHIVVFDKGIEPTCNKQGLSQGSHCALCGKIFIEQKTIPSCHKKGDLLDIPLEPVDSIPNPGLFECKNCKEHYWDSLSYEDIQIPFFSIEGDMDDISNTNKKNIKASYQSENYSFEYPATLKLQGTSSLGYPKKNYNIQFYMDNTFNRKQKVKLKDDWDAQNKYTLKANYIDTTHMRNIVSAQIYGDMVRSLDINDGLSDLKNGGL